VIRLLASILFALTAAPAQAQVEQALGIPAASPSPSPGASEPALTIADTQDAGADTRIAGRIRGIFAELPALAQVKVAVRKGVVALSGTVPQQTDIARAEAIASRVSGVVTVDNGLTRDVSVDVGAGTVNSLAGQFGKLVKLLPLIGVALAVALAIAFVGYLLAGLTGLWRKLTPNSYVADLIASAIRFSFVLAGVVVALNIIGAGTLLGAVLGGAGVIGLALGFALRDTIENYVASLMLSLRQPFRPNDHVVIDSFEGRVIRLTSRATILMTLDGNHLRIPNNQVFKAVILNYTRNPQRRFQFDLGVDADNDALAARKLGRETLAGLPFVLGQPGPEAVVVEVGDSNVVLRFLAWIDQAKSDLSKSRSLAIVAVKAALEGAGFGLPEPIYRLRFDPRTTPLPFETIAEATSAPRPSPAPAQKPSEAAHEDVRPDEEVKAMVEAERAAAPEGETDLLDHDRPVE
jgi:small-conductance mechanosensitive channel